MLFPAGNRQGSVRIPREIANKTLSIKAVTQSVPTVQVLSVQGHVSPLCHVGHVRRYREKQTDQCLLSSFTGGVCIPLQVLQQTSRHIVDGQISVHELTFEEFEEVLNALTDAHTSPLPAQIQLHGHGDISEALKQVCALCSSVPHSSLPDMHSDAADADLRFQHALVTCTASLLHWRLRRARIATGAGSGGASECERVHRAHEG